MSFNIAIIGATGAVGNKLLSSLIERRFSINNIYLLASRSSAGKKIFYGEKEYTIEFLNTFDFSKVDIAFFSAGAAVSKKFAVEAENKGCYVIDNTSYFRMHEEIPLIVPEVNENCLNGMKRKIVSNPNCSTIQMLVALQPIHKINKIKKIIVSTYQSVSGAGQQAINELSSQTKSLLNEQEVILKNFPKQIAFNVIPQIDTFIDNGFTKEEIKMVNETKKILDNDIEVNATCVRVPTYVGHAESVYIELENVMDLESLKNEILNNPAIKFSESDYHTPIDSADNDWVYVSRLRKDLYKDNAFNLWVVSDNLLKGAALNSVQIAEYLEERLKK